MPERLYFAPGEKVLVALVGGEQRRGVIHRSDFSDGLYLGVFCSWHLGCDTLEVMRNEYANFSYPSFRYAWRDVNWSEFYPWSSIVFVRSIEEEDDPRTS